MEALLAALLAIHLAWILWIIAGAVWTRGRFGLTVFHVLSQIWGIVVEVGPWPCPLTLAEQSLEAKTAIQTGLHTWTGGFLVHYLDAIVYPNLPVRVIDAFGVTVCALNLGIYTRRLWMARHR
jgi:hypothetical protein